MTAVLAPPLVFQSFTPNGIPNALGTIASYIAGTTTPQATYVDSTQTTQNQNPATLNNLGQLSLWLDPAKTYKFVTFDQLGNQIGFVDQVQGPLTAAAITQAFLGAILYPQSAAEQSAGVTPTNYQYTYGDVRRYGAISGSDCAAAVTSAAASNKLVIFPVGAWPMAATPSIPAGVILEGLAGSTFSGAGATALGFTTGALQHEIEETSNTNDFATHYIRRQANHTGGTVGTVCNALNATTFVGANVTNNEWALLGVVYNSALASGQNVGGYLQGNRMTTTATATWGGTIEVVDQSGQANPTVGLIGLEVDCRASGTDSNQNRVGLDVVISRRTPGTGAAMACYAGIRVQNTGEGANAAAATGVSIWANCANGFDTSIATIGSAAYKMAQGQAISFDASNVSQLSENVGTDIIHTINGVTKNALLHTGGLFVGSTQVIAAQITGYGTPTGGSHQASFAAGSITLPNLAAAVAQLIVDLKTHGMLGA